MEQAAEAAAAMVGEEDVRINKKSAFLSTARRSPTRSPSWSWAHRRVYDHVPVRSYSSNLEASRLRLCRAVATLRGLCRSQQRCAHLEAAGGIFSAAALFPLEVVKTNLQAAMNSRESTGQDPEEGKPDSVDDESSCKMSSEAIYDGGSIGDPPAEASPTISASGEVSALRVRGGVVAADDRGVKRRVKELGASAVGTREGKDARAPSVASVTRDVYAREGLCGFYKGVWYSMGQSSLEKAAYFYGYGWMKALVLGLTGGQELDTATDLVLGYLAEAFHLPLTIPIEVVLTKIVTAKENTNTFAVIQAILAEGGVGGFYKGIQAYVVLCLKPAIQYSVFNRLKGITLAYGTGGRGGVGARGLTAAQAFLIGAISRAVATVIVFPYIRAKVITMSRTGGSKTGKPPSVLASLSGIARDEGVLALFQGITPEITRGVLSAALMLMVKEKIHYIVKGAIVGSSNV